MTPATPRRSFMADAIETDATNWAHAILLKRRGIESGRRRGLAGSRRLGARGPFIGAPLRVGLSLGLGLRLGASLSGGLDFTLPVRLRLALGIGLLLALSLRGRLSLPLLLDLLFTLRLNPRLGLGLLLADQIRLFSRLALLRRDFLASTLLFDDQTLASIEIGGLLLPQLLLASGLDAAFLLHGISLRLARHVAPLLLSEIAVAGHIGRARGG